MRLADFAPYIDFDKISVDLLRDIHRALGPVETGADRGQLVQAIYWSADQEAQHSLEQRKLEAEINRIAAETRKLDRECDDGDPFSLDDDLVESFDPALPGLRTFRVSVLLQHGRQIDVMTAAKDRDEARLKVEAQYGKGRVRAISDQV